MAPRRAAVDNFAAAVGSGDLRRALQAVRDRLVKEIDRCDGSAVASLARELAAVLKQIDNLPSEKESSKVDELKGRRAARQKAAVPKRAAKSVKRGPGGNRARS